MPLSREPDFTSSPVAGPASGRYRRSKKVQPAAPRVCFLLLATSALVGGAAFGAGAAHAQVSPTTTSPGWSGGSSGVVSSDQLPALLAGRNQAGAAPTTVPVTPVTPVTPETTAPRPATTTTAPKTKPKPKKVKAVPAATDTTVPVVVAAAASKGTGTGTGTGSGASNDVWAGLRKCESGGRYDLNTGNGYYGAYQFSVTTWQKLGYTGYPHQAPPAVQDEAARKLQARAGWGQWPACARKLGLL